MREFLAVMVLLSIGVMCVSYATGWALRGPEKSCTGTR